MFQLAFGVFLEPLQACLTLDEELVAIAGEELGTLRGNGCDGAGRRSERSSAEEKA